MVWREREVHPHASELGPLYSGNNLRRENRLDAD
jgi:hypothetical protein